MWTKGTPAQRARVLKGLNIKFYARQLEIIRSDRRLRIIAGGERAGKSWVSAMDLVSRLPWGREFWLIGPMSNPSPLE